MERSVQNFRKLAKKTVDQGEIKLSRFISAPEWLSMMSAGEGAMMRLQEAWRNIFSSALQEVVEIPKQEIPDSESQARCRALFGPRNFFGMQEVAGSYGYAFSEQEIEERKAVRLLDRNGMLLSEEESWELIQLCHKEAPGEFVCCTAVPHSMCDVYEKHPDAFHPEHREWFWFCDRAQRQTWSEKKIPDFWFLIRKEPVPKSWYKSSVDQDAWLLETHSHERFARPEHIVYGDVLCEKASKGSVRLFCNEYMGRTLVPTAQGILVAVCRIPTGLLVNNVFGEPSWSCGVPSLWTSEP